MSAPISPCTLDDLVSHEALALRPVGDLDTTRPVVSVQLCLGAGDEDQLGPAELAVVVDDTFHPPVELDRLAEVFAQAQVSAVAYLETLPVPLREGWRAALEARGVAVLEIPRATRIADIIDTVSRSHVNPDTARFQRMLSMQQALVASLADAPDPVTGVIRRLARLLDATAGLLDDTGSVEASTGVVPFKMIRREIGDFNAPYLELHVSGWHGLAWRLPDRATHRKQWLIAVSSRNEFFDAFLRSAVGVAASLLDASRRIDVLTARQGQAVRRSLLRQALDLQPFDATDTLTEGFAAVGVNFLHEVRVVKIAHTDSRRPVAAGESSSLVDGIESAATAANLPCLIWQQANTATVLIEAVPADRDRLLDRLLAGESHVIVGIGRAIDRVGEIPMSNHDAALALQQVSRNPPQRLLSYDNLGFSANLLANVGGDQMEAWIDRLLGPLTDKPLLMEALETYFGNGMDVMATAKALHLHHNSLRYRLRKIEEAVGGELQDPETITALHLALAAASVRRESGEAGPLRPSRQVRGRDLGDGAAAPENALAAPGASPGNLGVTVRE